MWLTTQTHRSYVIIGNNHHDINEQRPRDSVPGIKAHNDSDNHTSTNEVEDRNNETNACD